MRRVVCSAGLAERGRRAPYRFQLRVCSCVRFVQRLKALYPVKLDPAKRTKSTLQRVRNCVNRASWCLPEHLLLRVRFFFVVLGVDIGGRPRITQQRWRQDG